jgi:hypothetical protein
LRGFASADGKMSFYMSISLSLLRGVDYFLQLMYKNPSIAARGALVQGFNRYPSGV